jgi:hypothetical protein
MDTQLRIVGLVSGTFGSWASAEPPHTAGIASEAPVAERKVRRLVGMVMLRRRLGLIDRMDADDKMVSAAALWLKMLVRRLKKKAIARRLFFLASVHDMIWP